MLEQITNAVKKHRRLSLPFGRSSIRDAQSGNVPSGSSPSPSKPAATLDWNIESPPIVFYGTAEDSSGALFSRQMVLSIEDESVQVESFEATLSIHIVHKQPYQLDCHDCQNETTELDSWKLLNYSTTLLKGSHSFPVSSLLQGSLPPSIDTPILSITYEFKAEAVISSIYSDSSSRIKFERTLPVKRSLPEPFDTHCSVHVFPPTTIKARANYKLVVYPTATNNVTLRLDGLMKHNVKVKTVDLWEPKMLTWKLEETIKSIAPACDKHNASAQAATGSGNEDEKGIVRVEKRIIGEKQMYEGWKSDFSGHEGIVDINFDFFVNRYAVNNNSRVRVLAYAYDLKTASGTEVTHSLQIELIVSKKYAPEGKAHLATPTGTGRTLGMHFAVVMAGHPGGGVSWENEAPPVYEGVSPSPPRYNTGEGVDHRGLPTEYDDMRVIDAQRAMNMNGTGE
ncbi:Arrestin (Or S-antigen) [Tolypocladium paradoxum]|uniref:Arrestin (Or S-antigen) n=1 Tax=Tolypocladium paradoxum TaxID=94208 RepID=A0A2S4KLR4_9HYPO|nr:Arrestin (Or S-antigen) [Tolypocladium paradoxum]